MRQHVIFETERLLMRQWCDEDLAPFIAMNENPIVRKYFPNIASVQESTSEYQRAKVHIEEFGFGAWALELKSGGQFIGFCGFKHPSLTFGIASGVELLWRLSDQYWNKGYATEAANFSLQLAFDKFEFDEAHALTTLNNQGSRRVMEKIKMVFDKEFMHPLIEVDNPLKKHVLYIIKKNFVTS